MNLRHSRMASGGIKSRPTTPRPPAPGITVIGAPPRRTDAIKVEQQVNADGSYTVNAYDMQGNLLPDVHVTARDYEKLNGDKEQHFSISYQQDGVFHNRAARRKKRKRKGR